MLSNIKKNNIYGEPVSLQYVILLSFILSYRFLIVQISSSVMSIYKNKPICLDDMVQGAVREAAPTNTASNAATATEKQGIQTVTIINTYVPT